MPTLIIFSGLSATGKTTLARGLARQIGATYLRIDSIEQALRDSDAVANPVNDAGYCVGYALAKENLLLGRHVVADSVNPLSVTRNAWLVVATEAQAQALEIEVRCSHVSEHRRRTEIRSSDIPGLRLPSWSDVISREYDPWDREHLVLDTAVDSIEAAIRKILDEFEKINRP